MRPICAVQDSFKHWTAARRRIDYPVRLSHPLTGTEFLVDGGLTAAYVTPEQPRRCAIRGMT
jgi:hypothetical protein